MRVDGIDEEKVANGFSLNIKSSGPLRYAVASGEKSEFQSKKLETLSSLFVRRIASPISGAIEMRRILLLRRISSVSPIESVTTIDLSFEFWMRATAPPDSTPCVA